MKTLGSLAALLLALVVPGSAQGAQFPDRDQTLHLVVPFAAGGGVDSAARLLAEQLRKQLGMSVVVDNKAGASGTIGGRFVQAAATDGYTLLFSAATHVLADQVLASAPYDPQADFAAVARVGEAPLMLVVPAKAATPRLSDVLAAARKVDAQFTAAIPAAGAPSHLATLLLAQQAGVRLTYVPYKGTQPALTDVAGGHVNMLLDSMISLLPLAKAGKVRPIAITSMQRSALAPDVPTVHESGIANYAYASWYGVWAPKGTPADVLARAGDEIRKACNTDESKAVWANQGAEYSPYNPQQFGEFVSAEVRRWSQVVKASGAKLD